MALGIFNRLRLCRGLAGQLLALDLEVPLLNIAPDALDDRVFDIPVPQLQSSSHSRRTLGPFRRASEGNQ
jgi:hypothetical protein